MHLQQLLQDCRRQSRKAQQALYDRFSAAMFLLCRRYLKSDEAAEEAMMNGFLKIFNALPRFEYKGDAGAISWIRRIMVHECLMLLRSQNSFLQLSEEFPETAVDSETFANMEAEDLFRLVTRLPVGYRTVFNLFAVEGYSHQEIGQMLEISEGTSRSQLSKARQMLQQMMLQNHNDYERRKTK
jgi:RNA polymerase sigma-70 factor (ECF subfamily)